MNEMMGRHHCTNTPLKPAPEQAVLKYNKTLDDEDGPSKDKFQVDLLTTPCYDCPVMTTVRLLSDGSEWSHGADD